ncbi:MAG: hypothetical protein HY541_03890 [Deltaproteobacteria bacterium]|nr:hypothetical protein [Deltaproteobacteria bacterium]
MCFWCGAVVFRLGQPIYGGHHPVDDVVKPKTGLYWGLKSLYAQDDLGFVSRDPFKTLADTVNWLRENHDSLRVSNKTVQPAVSSAAGG